MLRFRVFGVAGLLVLALAMLASGAARAQSDDVSMLRAAWVPTGTGLVSATPSRRAVETPLDLRLVSAIAAEAGIPIVITPMSRAAAEAALARGDVELLFPAAAPSEPGAAPYREERHVLLCARSLPALEATGAEAIEAAYANGWRIMVLRDAPYAPAIAQAIDARPEQRRVVGSAGEGFGAMMEGEAECIAAPRLSLLAGLAATPRAERAVAQIARDLGATSLYLDHAATLDPATVAALDAANTAMRADGRAEAQEMKTSRPILLRFAVAAPWFGWLDIIGTVAFALSGVMIARAERFSLLGAFVLAGLPAVGGGVIRDLLIDRDPIGILGDPLPLTLVIATVAASYVAMALAGRLAGTVRSLEARLPRALSPLAVLEVTDALGLAAFTVIGVSIAVRYDAEPLWLWGPVLAGLTGAGGGILRDLLRTGYENPALRTSFYAEVCVIWGTALTFAILYLLPSDHPMFIRLAIGFTVLGAFVTRMLVVITGLRSPRF
ncbi:TRIC cation channel family protein [Acuticoccus kandeliae]|uniref:TRIC cation channel family protein n=1 Tax=Acuticoccus kandeliae TaxID=2073160 RepID=UPI0013002BBF|nr:TRIC cation channel family protein [Acuticoccus kandeliae]